MVHPSFVALNKAGMFKSTANDSRLGKVVIAAVIVVVGAVCWGCGGLVGVG